MKKKGFVFYESYYEAIETLSKKNQLLAYNAIMRYALYQEEIPNLPPRVLVILKIAMPIIDANNQKYNKKIGRTLKNTSEFNIISDKVVLPPKNNLPTAYSDEFEEGKEFEY